MQALQYQHDGQYRFTGTLGYGNMDLHDHNGRVIGFFGYTLQFEGSKMVYFVSASGDCYNAHYYGGAISDIESYGTRSWLLRVLGDMGIQIELKTSNSVKMF
jgi:hypothetical protein